MTLKMTSVQVVETSVIVNNSSFQNYTNPDDHTQQTTDTPGFKPFAVIKATFGNENPELVDSNITRPTPDTEADTEQDCSTSVTTLQALHGCIRVSETTSTVVEWLTTGHSLRSTQLEERIKAQNKAFSDIAKTIHHGSKVCMYLMYMYMYMYLICHF